MTTYKDMTFCGFNKDCAIAKDCFRALTDEHRMKAKAQNLPICEFMTQPTCHRKIKKNMGSSEIPSNS